MRADLVVLRKTVEGSLVNVDKYMVILGEAVQVCWCGGGSALKVLATHQTTVDIYIGKREAT